MTALTALSLAHESAWCKRGRASTDSALVALGRSPAGRRAKQRRRPPCGGAGHPPLDQLRPAATKRTRDRRTRAPASGCCGFAFAASRAPSPALRRECAPYAAHLCCRRSGLPRELLRPVTQDQERCRTEITCPRPHWRTGTEEPPSTPRLAVHQRVWNSPRHGAEPPAKRLCCELPGAELGQARQ